jgi:hypothetical protein
MKEKSTDIPPTTKLKLFIYPGKHGNISSYPTQYAVGFETRNGDYVSQHFVLSWTDKYKEATMHFERWKEALGCLN